MKHYKYLSILFLFIIGTLGVSGLLFYHFDIIVDYLFITIANTKAFFSFLLIGIFILGVYVIFDRYFFFLSHLLVTRKMFYGPTFDNIPQNIFKEFLSKAREFRAVSEEGIYTDEIMDHAREAAMTSCLDSQEIDWGRTWLEFLGVIAPTIGFMGTLVGLMASFQELGAGGRLAGVLHGLALSMTTSLLGAIISVIFLSSAWFLGRLRRSFDDRLNKIIAEAQQYDRI